MRRIPLRQNVSPKGVTAREFQKIITTPLGQHPVDQFLFLEDLPVPYLGIKQDGDKNGDPVFPEPWIPHGTCEDDERWRTGGVLSFDNLFTTYVAQKDRPLIKEKAEKAIAEYLASEAYLALSQTLESAGNKSQIRKQLSALNKQKAECIQQAKRQITQQTVGQGIPKAEIAEMKRKVENACIQKFEQMDEYQNLMKALTTAITNTEKLAIERQINATIKQLKDDAKAEYLTTTKVEARRAKIKRSLFLEKENLYSTLSAILYNSPKVDKNGVRGKISPRPLLGSSEKTRKSDGTTAEVRVMYLSPATRSNKPYNNDWMNFEPYPQDMDEYAISQGMFPVDVDMSAIPDLKEKYDAVNAKFKKAGYNFRKNPNALSDIKLCINPNTCPHAGACAGLCLVDSGQMGTAIGAQRAGYFKTWFFYLYPLCFLRQLVTELIKESKASKKLGTSLYARLNGTSDIAWEKYIRMDALVEYCNNNNGDMGGFYDYTKYPIQDVYSENLGRVTKVGRMTAGNWQKQGGCPITYDLTFSLSEQLLASGGCGLPFVDHQKEATIQALDWIRAGFRVAVVVDQWKYHPKVPYRNENGKLILKVPQHAGTMHNAKIATWYERVPKLDEDGQPVLEEKTDLPIYEEDADGFPIYTLMEEKYAVTDFTDLCATAINSRDATQRAQNITIVDADETDFRFNDPRPSICILKPKGINVATPDNRYGFDAGTLYLFSRDDAGKRVPKALKGAQQQFVFSKQNVLRFQELCLQELNQSSPEKIDDFLLYVATAVNQKGGVYEANLIQGTQGLPAIMDRANALLQQNVFNIIDVVRRNRRNPARFGDRLTAVKHPEYGVWILVYRGGLVDIDGIDNWNTKAELKKALKKADLGLDSQNRVTGIINL